LLVVNVDPFARRRAEEDFERTLEVVASLAVRMEQQGHSVGLVANGSVKGGGPAIVPVARNDQQLPAILELLARLQMKPDRDLKDLLHHKVALTWGISCVYFSHKEDETVFFAKEYFAQRKTPVVFFVCQPHFPSGKEGLELQRKIYPLDEICIHKAGSK
jgi:ABC-type iron transport system FetAB ATPase subunit